MNTDITAGARQAQQWTADEVDRLRGENERLRVGLDAAIRAANLALFVIRKQNVMPNSSWQAGFEKDLATATAARGGDEQLATQKE